jgi:hypothetical protein
MQSRCRAARGNFFFVIIPHLFFIFDFMPPQCYFRGLYSSAFRAWSDLHYPPFDACHFSIFKKPRYSFYCNILTWWL